MDTILKYYPDLTSRQIQQLEMLGPLYADWNQKINVISRKDIDNLYLHHVLHAMSISKMVSFKDGSNILDLGTGGGFPGVPLAIMYPKCKFLLVDSIGKKLKVINAVSEAIGLENVVTKHSRVEDIKGVKFDFVVTRAVAELAQLFYWSRKHISQTHINTIPNGIIALKGGKIKEEIKAMPKGEYTEYTPISNHYKEPFFEDKYLVYVQG